MSRFKKKKGATKLLTGRMTICAGFIPLPSGPCFAMADIARIAIDDAVSKPRLRLSVVNLSILSRVTETEQ